MKDTRRYLNAATRGLWGRERRELRTELEGHIKVRVNELMLQGTREADAERQVLGELGAPARVSRGMVQVHTLPVALKGGLAAMILATALLSTVQHGQAQVQSIYGNVSNYGAAGYISFEQLKAALQKAGASMDGSYDRAVVTLPQAPVKSYPLRVDQENTIQRDGQTFIPVTPFMMALRNTGAELRLSGWNNPTLTGGGAEIHFETTDWRVINDIYSLALGGDLSWASSGSMALATLQPGVDTGQITLRDPALKAGKIYALVTPQARDWSAVDADGHKHGGKVVLISNFTPAEAGKATFRVYNDTRPLRFLGSVASFHTTLEPYLTTENMARWDARNPAPALLLELSGKVGPGAFKVIQLSQTRWN